jgi:hypothetical protein
MKAKRRPAADWKQVIKFTKAGQDDDAPRTAAQLQALARIGVSVDALNAAPRITPLLIRADGGLPQVINAMRLAVQDAVIGPFLRRYDSISASDRKHLPLEAVALSAGIDVTSLLGATMLALERQAQCEVRILAVTSHAKITKARVRYGELPGGHRDRQALDQILGLLPNPKGPTFIGKAIFGSGRAAMDQQKHQGRYYEDSQDEEENEDEVPINELDIDLDKLFPPANIMQERLVAIRQKSLPPADVSSNAPASLWKLPKRDT